MPRKSASKRKRSASRSASKTAQPLRLQRLLASAGFGSRRQCEELIEAGRVDVDGVSVTKLGTTVDPNLQKVRVDGVVLKKQKLVYYAVNKPVGFVTTNRDPHGRPRVIDLVPRDERVFPVGRLDRSSEGLILLTNDGELAQRLTHPKFGVRKVYRVTVAGKADGETMKKMRQGIYIAEGFVKVEGAKLLKTRSRATEMEIVLREGKNREIRRILARLGHKVQQLRRIAVGPLRLGEVPPGAYRVVTSQEVEKLWLATEAAANTTEDDSRRTRGVKKRGCKKSSARDGKTSATRGGKKSAKSGSSRRPTKKPREESPAAAIDSPYGRRESGKVGVVIGGDPEPETKTKSKSKGKRASKKGSTSSGRSKKSTRSSKAGRSSRSSRSEGSSRSKTTRSGNGTKKKTRGSQQKTQGTSKKRVTKKSGGKPRSGTKRKGRKN